MAIINLSQLPSNRPKVKGRPIDLSQLPDAQDFTPATPEELAAARDVKPKEKAFSFFENLLKAPGQLAEGLVGGAKGLGKSIVGGVELVQKGFEQVVERPPAQKAFAEKKFEEIGEALEPKGELQKAGFAAEKILEFIIPATKGAAVGTIAGATKTVQKIPVIFRTLLQPLIELAPPAVTAGAVTAVQEGELNKKALEVAAFDAALGGFGKILGKIAPQLFRIGANPAGKNFVQIEERAAEGVGRFAGTKKQIVEQTKNVIAKAGEKVRSLLAPIEQTFSRIDLGQAPRKFANELKDADPETAKAVVKFLNNWIKGGKSKLTAIELLEMKQNMAKFIGKIFQAGKEVDPSVAAKNQARLAIWSSIDDILNSLSPEISKLNKSMTVAYAIKEPLETALKKPFVDSIFSLLKLSGIPAITPLATGTAAVLEGASKALGPVGRQVIRTVGETTNNE